MLLEFFGFFIWCISKVFDTMKKFELFPGFTYFNFAIFLFTMPIIYKLLSFIFNIEFNNYMDDERTLRRMQRHDEIRLKDNLRTKDERDMNRRL